MMRIFYLIFALFIYAPLSHSASLIARGVAVGLPLGAVSNPGFVFDNIAVYFSEPQREKPSTNVMGEIPIFEYSTKTRWFDNQFRFILGPAFTWEKSEYVGRSWHYGVNTPLALAGLVHEIIPGLGIAGYVGGMTPVRAGVTQHDMWVFVNVNSLTYNLNDYDITLTMIYGNPGKNLMTNIKNKPNFLNLDFTFTRKFSGIEIGPIWYSSQDLNVDNKQQQFAMGGLVGFNVLGWTVQFWFGHDLFAYNYSEQMMNGYFRVKKAF